MPPRKSFVKTISVDVAARAHNCQHVRSHRVRKGEKRLKLKVDRTTEHFCVVCAVKSIEEDIKKLERIRKELVSEDYPDS